MSTLHFCCVSTLQWRKCVAEETEPAEFADRPARRLAERTRATRKPRERVDRDRDRDHDRGRVVAIVIDIATSSGRGDATKKIYQLTLYIRIYIHFFRVAITIIIRLECNIMTLLFYTYNIHTYKSIFI